jgi:hypothetical protein
LKERRKIYITDKLNLRPVNYQYGLRCSGRLASSRNNKNVDKVFRVMLSDQDVTTELTANKNDILYGYVQSILKKRCQCSIYVYA